MLPLSPLLQDAALLCESATVLRNHATKAISSARDRDAGVVTSRTNFTYLQVCHHPYVPLLLRV